MLSHTFEFFRSFVVVVVIVAVDCSYKLYYLNILNCQQELTGSLISMISNTITGPIHLLAVYDCFVRHIYIYSIISSHPHVLWSVLPIESLVYQLPVHYIRSACAFYHGPGPS